MTDKELNDNGKTLCDNCTVPACTHDRDFGNDCPYYEGEETTMKNPFKNDEEEIREWRKLTAESPNVYFDELNEEGQKEYLNKLEELRFKADLLTPAKKRKYRFRKIIELLTNDEYLIIMGWFEYTQNVSDEYMEGEELKIAKLLGFTK